MTNICPPDMKITSTIGLSGIFFIMKKINVSSVIDKFCKKDGTDMQKWMEKPFTQRGCTYATDGYIALKLLIEGDYENLDKPDMDYIFGKHTSQRYILSLAEIKAELSTAPLVDEVNIIPPSVVCEDCEEGYVDFEFSSKSGYTYIKEWECPVCDGSGFTDKEKRTPTGNKTYNSVSSVYLRGCYFAPKYLDLIVQLCDIISLDRVIMRSAHPKEVGFRGIPVKFELIDGIEIIVMQKMKDR